MKQRVIVIHFKGIIMWAAGVSVLLWANAAYNPPAALGIISFFFYGYACSRLYPWVSVHE